MMTDLALAFVGVLGGLVSLGGWCWVKSVRRSLPGDLRKAQLVYAERLFTSQMPSRMTLTAKVDRVYRALNGELTLVELKTRSAHRAYISDVIELSAQRCAVIGETGESVSGRAYVVVQGLDGCRSWHQVSLLSCDKVERLAKRHAALLAGTSKPWHTNVGALCQGCAFVRQCTQQAQVLRSE